VSRLAGSAKGFSSDPGPGQAAGLQGSGGSSLVTLVKLQSLDQTKSDQEGEGSLVFSLLLTCPAGGVKYL
jgi:hypothetical protein